MLTNEITSYEGEFYTITGAVMNPRPVQSPRPPIMLAAMGPVMLKRAARYADIWNSLSFLGACAVGMVGRKGFLPSGSNV